MFSAPISSITSIVDPSAVAKSTQPFIKNFIPPVPDASCPEVLQNIIIINSSMGSKYTILQTRNLI